MTITEAKRFYKEDKKEYQISNNSEFIKWINNSITEGYLPTNDFSSLQETIDSIVSWYELKYCERYISSLDGVYDSRFKNLKEISNEMDVEQLLYRLSHESLSLMECGYKAKGWCQSLVYDKNRKVTDSVAGIFMQVNYKNDLHRIPYFLVNARHRDGIVEPNFFLEEIVTEEIKLDDLLKVLREKHSEELEFSEIEETVLLHKYDLELRKKVLQMVALKLLYSKNTIPEKGYFRAKKFIQEFNEYFPDLNLDDSQIENIVSIDYSVEETEKTSSNKQSLSLKQLFGKGKLK